MAKLTPIEMEKFETLLAMGGGYVLDFSNQSFERFVKSTVNKNIASGNYDVYGNSKAKRLRAFWENEPDKIVGQLLENLVYYYDNKVNLGKSEIKVVKESLVKECLVVAFRLQGKDSTKPAAASEEDFLKKEVDEVDIALLKLPSAAVTIIQQRIVEIKKNLKNGCSMSVLFLAGSILEGVLLNIATLNPKDFNQAKSSPKDSSGKVKPFPEWSLNSLIDVCYETGFIGLDVKKYGHALRDFRNFIHPFEQMSAGFSPDSHTAEISWKVLKAALYDINVKLKA